MHSVIKVYNKMPYNVDYLDNKDFDYKYLTQDGICRLCWKEDAKKEINLKTQNNKIKGSLIEKISYILDIKLDAKCKPNKICEECYENVEKFNEFKIFCKSSDSKLTGILGSFLTTNIELNQLEEVNKIDLKEEKEESGSECDTYPGNDHSFSDCDDIPLSKAVTKNKRKYTYKKKDQPKTYCHSCNIDLKTDAKLLEHNQTLHGILKDGFKCFGCERKLKTRRKRVCHEVGFCKGLKRGYLCSICNRYLPKRRMYERHAMKHMLNLPIELPDDLFKCCKCKRMFKSKESMSEHIEEAHTVKKDFVCEQCGRVFTRLDYLNKHMLTHTGLKNHVCTLCGYRATQKSSLNVHMRKHTGDKPFPCDICPLKCLTSSNLIAHKLRHAGVKKFECVLCPKKFGYKASLEEHIAATHDKVKLFVCNICNTSYSRPGGLRRHIRTKHGKEPEDADKDMKKCSNDYMKTIDGFNVNVFDIGAQKIE